MAFLFAYSSAIKYYLSHLATDCQRAFQVESVYIYIYVYKIRNGMNVFLAGFLHGKP